MVRDHVGWNPCNCYFGMTPLRTELVVCVHYGSCPLRIRFLAFTIQPRPLHSPGLQRLWANSTGLPNYTIHGNNGIHLRLIGNECKEAWQHELQLLYGENARLSDRERSNWSHREWNRPYQNQTRGMERDVPDRPCNNSSIIRVHLSE